MKYSIVFSSHTGNTTQLAEVLKDMLPQEDCIYFGAPDKKALEAPLIFIGFWTDKGSCDEITKCFLQIIRNTKIFLFGTAGFGGNSEYFERILTSVKKNLDASVSVISSFMCQGKMPISVLWRYEKMLAKAADSTRIKEMIANFHTAETHPDQIDLDQLKTAVCMATRNGIDEKKN